jgi:hypothetical protein
MEVTLSSRGLSNFLSGQVGDDFQFIVGELSYPCSWIVADFLSPVVAQNHALDSSLLTHVVSTPDPDTQFEAFMALGYGYNLVVTDENRDFLLELTRELGNSELYFSILKQTESDILSHIDTLANSDFYDFSTPQSIAFLAEHLWEISDRVLDMIPFATLFEVLSSPSLRILDEDNLFKCIASRVAVDRDFVQLFQFVYFEYLSAGCISEFVKISQDCFDRISFPLWTAVCGRLSRPVSVASENPHLKKAQLDFAPDRTLSLNGILAHLTKEAEGNVHEKGVVTITSKSVWNREERFAVKNIADLTVKSEFLSADGPRQWICWDFHRNRVRPTHYAMRSTGIPFLKSWILEGSVDGSEWTKIGGATRARELMGDYATAVFPVSESVGCRFVRLTQTGPNSRDDNCLYLAAFELFGTFICWD